METQSLSFLKNIPSDRKLYSTLLGECYVVGYNQDRAMPITVCSKDGVKIRYAVDGRYLLGVGETTLFPKENCRDWFLWQKTLIESGDALIGPEGLVCRALSKTEDGWRVICEDGVFMELINTCITGWADYAEILKFETTFKSNGFKINKIGNMLTVERWVRNDQSNKFMEWADNYFLTKGNINIKNVRIILYDKYLEYSNEPRKYASPTAFKRRLQEYAKSRGLYFNPGRLDAVTHKPLFFDADGRPDIDDKTEGIEYITLGNDLYWRLYNNEILH